MTHRPPASIAVSAAGGDPVPTSTIVVADHHHPCVGELTRRAAAVRRVVGEQPADPVDHRRGGAHRTAAQAAPIERSRAARHVDSLMGSVAHDDVAADDHVTNVGRRGGEQDGGQWVARRSEPARRGLSKATVTKSARCADCEPAAAGPAEALVARRRGRGQQVVRADGCPGAARPVARRARPPSSPRTDRSRHGSPTRCTGRPRRRATPPSARSRRRARARSSGRCSSATGGPPASRCRRPST